VERDLSGPLLHVSNLSVHFAGRSAAWGRSAPPLRAVDDVSFAVAPHEILGLVGESGSGKSTLARAILCLLNATSGSVRFDGVDLLGLDAHSLKAVRRRMQVIFQDPYASLNPRMTAGDNIAEGLLLQGGLSRRERSVAVAELLHQVGLPATAAQRYPQEFSGGQRQRIGIARALAVQPSLIVADEPVSALDMSIQAQILNLLLDQQEQRGLALLFIGHDLSVIRHFCDRIMVMYLGRIVEIGPTESVFSSPRHPYTRALIDAAPVTHPARRRIRDMRGGEAPSLTAVPAGCAFQSRCPHAVTACRDGIPPLRTVAADHLAACLRDFPDG
jgi:oligopeptide/dipeptide ABC transporter ATP-binding protein